MRERSAKVRALGAELRTVRKRSGKTLGDVAKCLDVSMSSLSRSETGQRHACAEEIASLLTLYSVTGTERERLLHLARRAGDPGEWWETKNGLTHLGPALRGFEAKARRIEQFSPTLVPGLCQTRAYAWALMRSHKIPVADAGKLVDARMARQKLLDRRLALDYWVLLDEAVVRRPVGSREVMGDQLRRLIELSDRPNVVVQIIPFQVGAYPVTGPYFLMSFANEPPVVYVEHARASGFLDKAEDTQYFKNTAVRLRQLALPPDESAEYLTYLVADHYRE